MGSGSCHLAQITGPAKDNSKGASGATPNFFRAKTIFQVFLDQPQRSGIADPESPTGRRAAWRGQPRERTFPPAFEANVQIHVNGQGS